MGGDLLPLSCSVGLRRGRNQRTSLAHLPPAAKNQAMRSSLSILVLVASLVLPCCGEAEPVADGVEPAAPASQTYEGMSLDYLSKVKLRLITSHGEMMLSFRPDKAPNTVANFIKLAKSGFYDQSRFHRVIPGFMIQGGCPNTKPGATGAPGTGDPGYKIKAEFNDLPHERGVISMARSGHPDSAGCQFFIVHQYGPSSQGLDGKYTAFGKLVSGFETLDKIVNVRTNPGGAGTTPTQPVHLHEVIVIDP